MQTILDVAIIFKITARSRIGWWKKIKNKNLQNEQTKIYI